ncbi:MAG: Indole-3-glycerol phosphate synthase [Candidatus Bathyarchaeota archaeon BA2]|nr:MAG: Indole-3-glycerol phosphate synthase [Candidatus Bathyarchaeota archaeon BA2]
MADFLDVLARDAKETINEGYYEVSTQIPTPSVSLKKAILESKRIPIITEIKAASPSLGTIRKNFNPEEVAGAMEKGGAVGISVLTEPKHFKGSLFSLIKVRKAVKLPILMKDIIIGSTQLETASKIGANAVLLIEALFERKYCEYDVHEMIAQAQTKNLEVLLETHNEDEFQSAINSNADLIGINNRDLRTLKVDLGVTKRILEKNDAHGKVVVSESGVKTPADLHFLRECGAQAFLIGSAIMMAGNIEKRVKEFAFAL